MSFDRTKMILIFLKCYFYLKVIDFQGYYIWTDKAIIESANNKFKVENI